MAHFFNTFKFLKLIEPVVFCKKQLILYEHFSFSLSLSVIVIIPSHAHSFNSSHQLFIFSSLTFRSAITRFFFNNVLPSQTGSSILPLSYRVHTQLPCLRMGFYIAKCVQPTEVFQTFQSFQLQLCVQYVWFLEESL